MSCQSCFSGSRIVHVAVLRSSNQSPVIRFVIVAFAIFILVKQINRLQRKEPAAEPAPPPEPRRDEVLLAEIRDILKARA